MQVKTSNNMIALSQTFDAPRSLVFSMFKDPYAHKWWGPAEYPITVSHQDFTPGGTWFYCMTGPDGDEAWGKAVYEEIDEPNRIVYQDYFTDAEGTIDDTLPMGTVTVTFDEKDGKTTITSAGEYGSAEEVQELIEMGIAEGMADTWQQLDKLLAKSQGVATATV